MKTIKIILFLIFTIFNVSITDAGNTPNKIRDLESPNKLNNPPKIDSYNGSKSENAKKYFDLGIIAGRDGNLRKAIDNYKSAIREDSLFVEAYDNMGRAFRGLGENDSAIYYYKKSLELYPEGPFAIQNIGIAYLMNEDYNNALETYNTLIDLYPDSPEGYYGLAQVRFYTNYYDDALESIDLAIKKYLKNRSPVVSDAYIMKALIYSGLKDEENVIKYLRLAKENGAKLSPQMEEVLNRSNRNATANDEIDTGTILKAIDWYLDTPLTEDDAEKRKKLGSEIMIWVIESPEVSVLVDGDLMAEDCGECLLAFTFSWTKYTLENDAKEDKVANCVFAIRSTTNFYVKNREFLGEKPKLNELIELELDGKLEDKVVEIFKKIEENKK